MNNLKLKLGLLLDSYEVPAWFLCSIDRIINSGCAEISLVIINDRDVPVHGSSWLNKVVGKPKELIYQLCNKMDENAFLREPNAFTPMDLQKLVAGVQTMRIKPDRDGNAELFKSEDVKIIREHHVDILIKLGFHQLCGDILTAAKYGVWFYTHSDNRVKRGDPSGFWEVVESWPETGATLSIADEQSTNGKAIYRSSYLTYPFSPARNRNTAFWGASSFLPRQISLLYRLGETKFFQEVAKFDNGFDFYDRKQYSTPTNLTSVKLYTKLLFRQLSELWQRAFYLETWFLLADFSICKASSFCDFKKIVPPKDRFWADPQLIQKDDKNFIFVEEYIYKNHKGHISVIEMDAHGLCKDPVPILETDYHLSYPFVFECDEKYYMVPESAQNHSIDIYECVAFPDQWKFKMTLMNNVLAVDTTLFFHLGKWWLFTGLAENEGAFPEVELFLFYSDDFLTTGWKSHPCNPVISDVTCARPAGKIFSKDGKIYRPSQDCSKTYGYGFNINEIQCLTETEYLEKKVAAVKPNWDHRLIATHTYSSAEGTTIIDGLTRRSKLF